jgi:hypothetical protein
MVRYRRRGFQVGRQADEIAGLSQLFDQRRALPMSLRTRLSNAIHDRNRTSQGESGMFRVYEERASPSTRSLAGLVWQR